MTTLYHLRPERWPQVSAQELWGVLTVIIAFSLCAVLPREAFAADPPNAPAASGGRTPSASSWTITFRYGGGTPSDAGPLGHCTATFHGDGRVKIESQGRKGVPGPSRIVVYENDAIPPEFVQVISDAADAALQEKPFKRHRQVADGHFLRLDRSGAVESRIYHEELLEFSEAPPAMLKFVALVNALLPATERLPIALNPPSRSR